MPSAIPAMRGKFGSTEFFLVTMHAKELSERLVIPKEMKGWDDLSLEERFQRDVNYNRVRKHIAPYLAKDEDRFFGAFIVAMMNHEDVEFEPIGKISSLPKLYQNAADAFGFLNFQGNEVLVPLDGQHRLAAIRFAITGKDDRGRDIGSFDPTESVASDLCTVILVRYDEEKARRIFNKVNRYAKATTKGENLITADDDIVAIITREKIANEDLIDPRLVRYKSNTLPVRAHEFTTLSTLYDATGLVLEETFGAIDRTRLPENHADRQLMTQTAIEFWDHICERVREFKAGLHDASENADARRQEIRRESLLGKPFGQLVLVSTVLRLRKERSDGSRLTWDEVEERINTVDWDPEEDSWQGVMMSGARILSGKTNARFAARFVAYLLGDPLDDEEREKLDDDYGSRLAVERPLPPRLFEES